MKMDPMHLWVKEKTQYQQVNNYIKNKIDTELKKQNIRATIQQRIKDDLSLRRKLLTKGNTLKQYNSIHDKSGLRIICNYMSDLDPISKVILDNFIKVKYEDFRRSNKPNWIGYQAIHIDVKVKKNDTDIQKSMVNKITEIQIKTALQNAWGENNHDLTYKNSIQIPSKILRNVNLLNGLIEIADNEFDAIYHRIQQTNKLSLFGILFLLDDIFMKTFQLPYNINLTTFFIKRFRSYYTKRYTTSEFKNELVDFVNTNLNTIHYVFKNRKPIGEDSIFFKQPELLLIYLSLNKNKCEFQEEWQKHLDMDMLETISAWFGMSIY